MLRHSSKLLISSLTVLYCLTMPISMAFGKEKAKDSPPLYIGVLVPLTGEYASTGMSMLNGINLYLEKMNTEGGVNGRSIQLVLMNTESDMDIGLEQVEKATKDKRLQLVLGNAISSLAEKASPLYKAAKLPVLTPSASSTKVAENNDWFFMLNPSNKFKSMTLAYSAMYLGDIKNMMVIYDPQNAFSANMQENFETLFKVSDEYTIKNWEISAPDEDVPAFTRLAKQIKQHLSEQEDTALFITLYPSQNAQMLMALRRQGIEHKILLAGLGSGQLFRPILQNSPEEKKYPGYFAANIFGIDGFGMDTLGQEAQELRDIYHHRFNQQEINNDVMFSYDAIKVSIEALRAINAKGENIQQEREAFREYLAALNSPEHSIKGLTGPIYFDADGFVVKAANLITYKNWHRISAPTQFRAVENPKKVIGFNKKLEAQDILQMDEQYFYKTHIIYSNIEMLNIEEIDLDKKTAWLDFYVWFAGHDSVDFSQIEFLNAVKKVELGKPIRKDRVKHYAYSLYRVQGHFYMDFLPQYQEHYALEEHIVGVRFQHGILPFNRLIYVEDTGGNLLSSKSTQAQIRRNLSLFMQNWEIKKTQTYQDIISKPLRGDFKYDEYGDEVDFSRFNHIRLVKENRFTLRRNMSEMTALYTAIFSLFALIVLVMFRFVRYRHYPLSKGYRLTWLLKLPIIAIFLLAAESVILTNFIENDASHLQAVYTLFDIIWWMVPAYILVSGIEKFIWLPIEKKGGTPVPVLMRKMVSFIIYMLATFCVIGFVFNMKVTSLLATSGMLVTIIGLAVKMNISNIFSGIAINVDRPFRMGDWIQIGDYPAGQVLDTTWRATQIKTLGNDILSIPNAVAADSTVQNYHYPSDVCSEIQLVYIDFSHSPKQIRLLLLEAMQSVPDVLDEPNPGVSFRIGQWANEYKAIFHVKGYSARNQVCNQVNEEIYLHLQANNISPARPPNMTNVP